MAAPGRVVALFGPTAVGKTAVAIELAELLRGRGEDPVAICADALQVYAGLETLSGAASPAEQERLEHRLLGFVPVDRTFSVGGYAPLAHREIDAALDSGRRPLVVGGTGLYLRAALTDLHLRPPPPPELRRRLELAVQERGAPALHAVLRERAPARAAEVEPTDRSRVIRALELVEMGEGDEGAGSANRPQLWTSEMRRPTLLVGLTMDRAELYRRVDARVDALVAEGAAAEARRAVDRGASRTARKALGFEELLGGDVDGMRRRTRNYAKRQLTWMRKLGAIEVMDVTGVTAPEVATQVAGRLTR